MNQVAHAPFLAVKELVKEHRARSGKRVRALDGVSWETPHGAFWAVTGPSGSGKSTLLLLLGALDRPTAGEVIFDGRSLAGCSEFELTRTRRRVGFVFQNFALVERLTAWENVVYPLVPRGVPRRQRWGVASALLDRLGVADQALKRPAELSGGEQQRVAIARALACDPEVILADEPTSNLDPAAAERVLALFAERQAAGATIVVASHAPEIIARADRMVRLDQGRLQGGN